MIDLAPNREQASLQQTARALLADRAPLERVREVEESDEGFSVELWKEMARLDWLRLGHREEVGGVGGGLRELTLLYAELGRSLVETPHLTSSVIAGAVLDEAGDSSLLEAILDGTAIVATALIEESAAYGPEGVQLSASVAGETVSLRGTKLLVPFASSASHFLVVARTRPGEGDDGITVALVPTEAPGISVERLPNIAGYPLFAVTFSGAASGRLVGAPGQGWRLLAPVLERAAVLRAAQVVGAAERLLQLAVDYAQTREQFGAKIGSYQAVQYLCSDIAIDAELSRLFVQNVAVLEEAGESITVAAPMAKAYASRAARRVANRAHEVFAGLAFMLDCDVQLFTRRLKHWELDLGDDSHHRHRIAAALVGRE